MLFSLDPENPGPLFVQIAAAIRRAMSTGDVTPGETLPPARTLAATVGVNMHTVLRAYAVLEAEGLLRVRRGRGAIVLDIAPQRIELRERAAGLLAAARAHGLNTDDVIRLIREIP